MSANDSGGGEQPISFLDEQQNLFVRAQRKSGRRIDQLLSEIARAATREGSAIRSMLTARHGLDAAEADFLVELAGTVDAAAVEQDKQTLKRAFGYRNYHHDLWEVLVEDLDRPFFAATRLLGLSHYGPASEFLEECYYEKGALEPLVTTYSENKEWKAVWFEPLLQALETAGRVELIERFCETIARRARAEFFGEKALLDRYGDHERVAALKAAAIEAYDRGIAWLERVERVDAAQRLAEARDMLREERWPELPPVSDLRRVDEAVFWELIRRSGPGTPEQTAVLGELLNSFGAADIQRFGALYAGQMMKLYHWNAWALAYAARGGCSDDAFMEFRTWLILRGDPELVALAIADPQRAAERVPKHPQLPAGSLLPLIDEAHLRRKGITPILPNIDLARPKGREWPEADFETWFPELTRHYAGEEGDARLPG